MTHEELKIEVGKFLYSSEWGGRTSLPSITVEILMTVFAESIYARKYWEAKIKEEGLIKDSSHSEPESKPKTDLVAISREEVWLRAYVSALRNEVTYPSSTSWADVCLKAFDERFKPAKW